MINSENIYEIKDINSVSYLLKDNLLFSQTAYKVLQGQERNGFIKCAKILHNGNIKLVYLASKYKSLQSLLSSLVPEVFLLIISNAIKTIMDAKSNGFLQCENIDVSFDKIFVDNNNYKTKLVYLPINSESSYKTHAIFENEFKTNTINAINQHPNIVNQTTMRIGYEINSNALTLDNIYQQIKTSGYTAPENVIPEEIRIIPASNTTKPAIALKSLDKNELIIPINKPEFILGKNPELVDGVIPDNKAVSRVHCKLFASNGSYCIMDMSSANGTFVNDKKIPPSQMIQIKVSDHIKIANSKFVLIDYGRYHNG